MEKDERIAWDKINILLADDDQDDCLFFREALEELELTSQLSIVHDGEQLMQVLSQLVALGEDSNVSLPDVLFLDLNMPRKTGFECLSEIKKIEALQHIPIVIFTTSLDINVVDMLYDHGADYYIRKPGKFSALKSVIHDALNRTCREHSPQPNREQFILQSVNN